MEDEVIDIDDEPVEFEKSSIPTKIDIVVLEEENDGDLAEDSKEITEEEITPNAFSDEMMKN